jgi:hypothetical protein
MPPLIVLVIAALCGGLSQVAAVGKTVFARSSVCRKVRGRGGEGPSNALMRYGLTTTPAAR